MKRILLALGIALATVALPTASADLIGDTYTISMSAGDGTGEVNILTTTGTRTLGSPISTVGFNNLGFFNGADPLDQITVFDSVVQTQLANSTQFDIFIEIVSEDIDTNALTPLIDPSSEPFFNITFDRLFIDLGTFHSSPDTLMISQAGFTNWSFVEATAALINLDNTLGPDMAAIVPTSTLPEFGGTFSFVSSTSLTTGAVDAAAGVNLGPPAGVFMQLTYNAQAVPEPCSVGLILSSILAFCVRRRRASAVA